MGSSSREPGNKRILFAGDTAYGSFFREAREQLGAIDLALLPIGAYEPRWFMQAVHMNPEEAVQAHVDLGAATSIGMHFGTFQLTTEGIDEPLQGLNAACAARGNPRARFCTLAFGESWRLRVMSALRAEGPPRSGLPPKAAYASEYTHSPDARPRAR